MAKKKQKKATIPKKEVKKKRLPRKTKKLKARKNLTAQLKKEKKELKRKRSNLYSKRSRLKKKLKHFTLRKVTKDKERNTERNRVFRELKKANEEIDELNTLLGTKKEEKEKKPVPFEDAKGFELEEHVVIWKAKEKIDSLLREGKMKTYIIEGKKYSKDDASGIFLAFFQLESLAYLSTTTIYDVLFSRNDKTKTIYITI